MYSFPGWYAKVVSGAVSPKRGKLIESSKAMHWEQD